MTCRRLAWVLGAVVVVAAIVPVNAHGQPPTKCLTNIPRASRSTCPAICSTPAPISRRGSVVLHRSSSTRKTSRTGVAWARALRLPHPPVRRPRRAPRPRQALRGLRVPRPRRAPRPRRVPRLRRLRRFQRVRRLRRVRPARRLRAIQGDDVLLSRPGVAACGGVQPRPDVAAVFAEPGCSGSVSHRGGRQRDRARDLQSVVAVVGAANRRRDELATHSFAPARPRDSGNARLGPGPRPNSPG